MATKKSRNLILLVSVILALLSVLMQFGVIIIPGLMSYTFWLMVIAYGLVLGAR